MIRVRQSGPNVRQLLPLAALLLALTTPAHARDLPTIRVVATDPAPGRTLARDQALYLRLAYDSTEPLRIQAAGYRDGAEVRDGVRWNPAPVLAAGSGEAVAWLAYGKPTRLDEIRIEVADASWQPLLVVKVPTGAAWTADARAAPPRAEWVARLGDAQQRAASESVADAPRDAGDDLFDLLLGPLVVLSLPGYLVLQTLFGLRWSGAWRIAALVPLTIMLPVLGHALFALVAGSNLWPIVLIFAAPFAFAYLALVGGSRWCIRAVG
jgi:hypothetical protein